MIRFMDTMLFHRYIMNIHIFSISEGFHHLHDSTSFNFRGPQICLMVGGVSSGPDNAREWSETSSRSREIHRTSSHSRPRSRGNAPPVARKDREYDGYFWMCDWVTESSTWSSMNPAILMVFLTHFSTFFWGLGLASQNLAGPNLKALLGKRGHEARRILKSHRLFTSGTQWNLWAKTLLISQPQVAQRPLDPKLFIVGTKCFFDCPAWIAWTVINMRNWVISRFLFPL